MEIWQKIKSLKLAGTGLDLIQKNLIKRTYQQQNHKDMNWSKKQAEALVASLEDKNIFQERRIITVTTGIIFILISIIALSACSGPEETGQEASDKPAVRTARVVTVSHQPEIRQSGTIFASREANLGAGFPGRLEDVYYQEGDAVEKDALLAELSGEMRAQAKAEYMTLKKDYERVSRLVDNGTVTRQEYDHIKGRYEASRAQYEMAKRNSRIRAPFSGVIVDYLVNQGENYFLNLNLEPGYSNTSGILRLMQLDTLVVETDVNERDLGRISEGLPAKIIPEAHPDMHIEGVVSSIKPYLSTRSRTATASIRIPNPGMILKPGMSARVNIDLPAEEVMVVPTEALYRDPEHERDQVFAVRDGRVSIYPVNRLFSIGDDLVIEGLEEGMEVITGGKGRVQENDHVRIVK